MRYVDIKQSHLGQFQGRKIRGSVGKVLASFSPLATLQKLPASRFKARTKILKILPLKPSRGGAIDASVPSESQLYSKVIARGFFIELTLADVTTDIKSILRFLLKSIARTFGLSLQAVKGPFTLIYELPAAGQDTMRFRDEKSVSCAKYRHFFLTEIMAFPNSR